MKLIIVESPTKAKTLSKFLGKAYHIEASMGHVRDLPKSTLGVDVEHDFEPHYIIPRDKVKHANVLKKIAKKADEIILATDPDREGEAIAWHVATILTDPSKNLPAGKAGLKVKSKKFSRIVFHEITETAIKEALLHPKTIDLPLVDAQQARRILDRLVGYKLSPLLWQKLSKKWLSAGRVQSVTVRLIVEREREREKFKSVEYFTIDGVFKSQNSEPASPAGRRNDQEIVASLVSKDGVKYESTLSFDLFDGKYTTNVTSIRSEAQTSSIISDLKEPFTVSAVDKKEIRRSPSAPYTTSTLQQDAGRKLSYSSKKTMQLAQKLYEEGFITYHRTDSVNLAEKFISEARAFIKKTYGDQYLPKESKAFKTKSKVAQEAHEAIRPTKVEVNSSELIVNSSEMNRDHMRLYELIWKRAVACQSTDAVFDATTIDITSNNALPAGGQGYVFSVSGSVIKFDGYLRITGRDAEDKVIPNIAVSDVLNLMQSTPLIHTSNPPPRYTEASLVKTLEEKDIGRPSTYAPIISTIIDRQYVTREEKKLVPTELGSMVTDFLVKYFGSIIDLPFTAKMEANLDAIANGEKKWQPVIREFYEPFEKILASTYDTAEKVALTEEAIDEKCPNCTSALVIRTGKYGKFVACTNFPTCTYTRQYGEKIDVACPKCGKSIVVKKSKRGKQFYGCSAYPACTFAAWKKEDIK